MLVRQSVATQVGHVLKGYMVLHGVSLDAIYSQRSILKYVLTGTLAAFTTHASGVHVHRDHIFMTATTVPEFEHGGHVIIMETASAVLQKEEIC